MGAKQRGMFILAFLAVQGQLALAGAHDRVVNRRDDRGLEQVTSLAIIVGVAVIVGIAILVKLKTSMNTATSSTTGKLDTSVSTFTG